MSLSKCSMVALFTDFGIDDPYVGQMHAVLAQKAPAVPVINLMHTVPRFDIRAGAYLLPALAQVLPSQTVLVCVVDPGVGGPRQPIVVHTGERWFVGPDNGLFTLIERRADHVVRYTVSWRGPRLSNTFHGRDLFAPIGANLANGDYSTIHVDHTKTADPDWPDELDAVVYIDHYGNAITGRRSCTLDPNQDILVAGRRLSYARTFQDVQPGAAFWYGNANDLVEIAANQASIADKWGLRIGDSIEILA